MPRINFCATVLVSALLLLSTASEAAAPANRDERIMRAVEKVVAEYKIYATCSALRPGVFELVQESWDSQIRDGADALRKINPSVALVARYANAVAPSRIFDPTMLLSDAIEYCKTNYEQYMQLAMFANSSLYSIIEQASSENKK